MAKSAFNVKRGTFCKFAASYERLAFVRENSGEGKLYKTELRIAIPRAYARSPARRNREPVKHGFPERSFPEEISAPPAKNIPAKRSVASNDETRCSKPFRFTTNSPRAQTEFEIRNARL